MIISLIAAMARNRVIGSNNAIPWHIPADLQRFKKLTLGHPLIMGRKTFESIGRPLPGRMTIVVTRQAHYRQEGCAIAYNLAEALELAGNAGEVFICGGGDLYQQALPHADRIYLTIVHRDCTGDVLFPLLPDDYIEVEKETHRDYSFILYQRRGGKTGRSDP